MMYGSHWLLCVLLHTAKKYAELHGGQGDRKKEKKEKAPKQQEPKKEKAKPKAPVGTTHDSELFHTLLLTVLCTLLGVDSW